MTHFAHLAAAHHAGYETHRLGDLLQYEQPGKYLVSSTAYDDSYATPVLTAGQTFVLGRTPETHGIYQASESAPVLIFDDFTTAFQWVDFPFKAKSSAMKILTLAPGAPTSLRYLWHVMHTLRYKPRDHSRQWIATFSNLEVALPTREVQSAIVGALDGWGSALDRLNQALEGEVLAQTRLRGELRRRLLVGNKGTSTRVLLRDIASFTNAKAHEKLVSPDGTIALMTARFVSRGEANRFVHPKDVLTPAFEGDVALVMSDLPNGRALAKTFYVDASDRYAANQRVCLLRPLDDQVLSARFLCHVMDRNPQLLAYNNGIDQTHLKKDAILDVSLALPTLKEQDSLVASLDRLDHSHGVLCERLVREIELRRSQLDTYRAKLLTFEEKVA